MLNPESIYRTQESYKNNECKELFHVRYYILEEFFWKDEVTS